MKHLYHWLSLKWWWRLRYRKQRNSMIHNVPCWEKISDLLLNRVMNWFLRRVTSHARKNRQLLKCKMKQSRRRKLLGYLHYQYLKRRFQLSPCPRPRVSLRHQTMTSKLIMSNNQQLMLIKIAARTVYILREDKLRREYSQKMYLNRSAQAKEKANSWIKSRRAGL